MTDREKLIALIAAAQDCPYDDGDMDSCAECKWFSDDNCIAGMIADHLLANGAVVRERGKWIYKDTCGKNTGKFHCSVCDKIPKSLNTEDFCPNCGADMRGAVNDG